MKKIIIATSAALLLSAALAGTVFAENTAVTRPAVTGDSTAMLSCVASAVAKREASIQSAFSTLSAAWMSAFQTRASDLAAAWVMTDKTARNTAVRAAWTKFGTAQKTSKGAYNTAKNAAWTQFATDRKACKAPATGESAAGDSL